MRAWLAYLWYEIVFWATCFGTLIFFSYRVRGRHHVPIKGPVLIIANHQCYIDPTLVGLASPRHIYFLARRTLWKHPWFAALIASVNAVPVDQESGGAEGLKTVLKLLHAGHAVIIFPEGERTPDGVMHQLKPGITLIIKRAAAPIVPMGIVGGADAWPRWQLLPILAPIFLPATHRHIAVSVGPPLDAQRYAALSREESLAELFREIQAQMENAERLRRK